MRNLYLPLTISLSLLAIPVTSIPLLSSTAYSQEKSNIKGEMLSIYSAYKELQPYLNQSEKFFNPKNQDNITSIVKRLRESFHKIESFDKKYRDQPGFASNLEVITDLLTQLSSDVATGPSDYTFMRLKAVSQNCATCHEIYSPNIKFYDPESITIPGTTLEKANFFLATRQFDEAERYLYQAATESSSSSDTINTLRKWLVVMTIVKNNPSLAYTKLVKAMESRNDLLIYERQEVNSWLSALEKWSKDKTTLPPLRKAKLILRSTLQSAEPYYSITPAVDLLRVIGILHKAMNAGTITKEERKDALYLLGLSYSKISQYFIDELPEIYLELCIKEFPGTEQAKASFAIYKEIITLGYTGSSGTNIPGDVLSKLDDLYRVAHGIPVYRDRI